MDRKSSEKALASVSAAKRLAPVLEDCYLDKREAADYLSLGLRTLEDRLHSIPRFRLGSKKLLFKKSELDEWMEQFRQTTSDTDIGALADQVVAKVLGADG